MEQAWFLPVGKNNKTHHSVICLNKKSKWVERHQRTRDVHMKVTWRLYCAAPAAQCADFMPCCPGRRVAAGVSGGKRPHSAPLGNPREKSRTGCVAVCSVAVHVVWFQNRSCGNILWLGFNGKPRWVKWSLQFHFKNRGENEARNNLH